MQWPQVKNPGGTIQLKILAVIGIVIVVAFVAMTIFQKDLETTATQSGEPKISVEFKTLFENFQRDGYMTVEHQTNKVFIDPTYWNRIDASAKKTFAMRLAVYCAATGPNGKWVKIYDKRTAKKIAEYDAWGIEVY